MLVLLQADLFNEVHPCSDPICPAGAPDWNYKVSSDKEKFNWRQWAYREHQMHACVLKMHSSKLRVVGTT